MAIRTSLSDPLQIAELTVGDGIVGVTLCPGKRGDSVFGGDWERDLATDVAAIRGWGASAVVTLIEGDEFKKLGVERLPGAVRGAGIEWHHLPVKDVTAPDHAFENRWVYAGARLRERLRAGDRVLVHCRGGLGRAGSVAARLLVEFGADPGEAIQQVRAVRPGAIETRAQQRWVEAQRPVDVARDARTSRELACLLGGAIGDALGYRVEFDSLAAIRRKYGQEGIRLAAAGGVLEVSDDTQMTLFTLEGMQRAARDGVPLNDAIRAAYRDWLRTQSGRSASSAAQWETGLMGHSSLWRAQAPGNTCLSALRAGGRGSAENPINDSKGCGGVMRTAPLGFLGDGVADLEVYAAGVSAAALTHGHPDGWAPSGVMSLAVRRLLADASWLDAMKAGVAALAVHPQATGTQKLLNEVASAVGEGAAHASASFGQGWVGDEALAVGLHAAATAGSFSEAIEVASNHDGDSDSTASIAGQLYGAKHGLAALPAECVYRLDVLEPLLELVGDWEGVRRDATR
jgi:ADP-ribosylglycohydrolase/protein-tyrosine phosphatase